MCSGKEALAVDGRQAGWLPAHSHTPLPPTLKPPPPSRPCPPPLPCWLQFLTAKPVVYLVNLSERDYQRKKNKWLPKLFEWVKASVAVGHWWHWWWCHCWSLLLGVCCWHRWLRGTPCMACPSPAPAAPPTPVSAHAAGRVCQPPLHAAHCAAHRLLHHSPSPLCPALQAHGGDPIIPFSGALESKLLDMPEDEREVYCKEVSLLYCLLYCTAAVPLFQLMLSTCSAGRHVR